MIFSEFGSEMEDFWQKEDQNYNLFLHLNAFATYLIGRDKVLVFCYFYFLIVRLPDYNRAMMNS